MSSGTVKIKEKPLTPSSIRPKTFKIMFLDLEYKIRKDSRYADQLARLCLRMDKYQKMAVHDLRMREPLRQTIMDMLEHTEYNLSPLLGYYFPAYPKHKPFSLVNFPHAHAFFNINLGRGAYTVFRGSRQIIKTTCMAARNIIATQMIAPLHVMSICPRAEQLKTIGDKYKEIEGSYRFFRYHKNLRNNLYFKEYPNKSVLKLLYILTNADKVRGNSFDWIDYDEYQDMDEKLELEINEIQTQSDYPMITYSGTSKTVDSALEVAFEKSSKGLWMMKCPGCGHHNHPTLENNVFAMVRPSGVVCSKCGHKLNVREGRWEHQSEDMLRKGRVGFHVPKIIVPENTENKSKWHIIYEQSRSKNKKQFLEEVLGIATQAGAREISQKDMENICMLGPQDKLELKAEKKGYRYVISGCDWGGSDYLPSFRTKESHTVHAMVGVTVDWKFDIIHMAQYSGMGYEEIADAIVSDHKRLRGYALASDFGVGAVYNMELRKRMNPHKHIIFNYTGPKTKYVAEPKEEHLFNQLSLNRTESITTLFGDIKNKRLRCFRWEQAQERLLEFLNLYRSPQENVKTGVSSLLYIKHGAKPDDTLHAVNFAVNLAKIVSGEDMFTDEALRDEVLGRIHSGPALMGHADVGMIHG